MDSSLPRIAGRILLGSSIVASVFVGVPARAETVRSAATKTYVVGYAAAGVPVRGARVKVFDEDGDRIAFKTTSDQNGYFVLELPRNHNKITVVATGGRLRGGPSVDGSLRAVHVDPGLHNNVYLNPVTTVIAAYLDAHPRASLREAQRKVRKGLSLHRFDRIDRPLRFRVDYFDGVKFMKRANRNGGLDSYVEKLIRRIDNGRPPVHFRPSPAQSLRRPMSIADTLIANGPMLSSIASGVSIVSGIGSVVNDIIGWAQQPQHTIDDVYSQVVDIKNELDAVSTAIANLTTDVQNVQKSLNSDAYNNALKAVQALAGTVDNTQTAFDDLVHNAMSSSFSQNVVDARNATIRTNVITIENEFTSSDDVFHDALLPSISSTPAYQLLGDLLLGKNDNWMTPEASQQLENLASFVLNHQALAFNLIMRYETSLAPDDPTVTLTNAVDLYLGSSDDAKSWLQADPPGATPTTIPPAGTLNAELTYLGETDRVPANTAVYKGGLMWQSRNAPFFSAAQFLPSDYSCGPYIVDSGYPGSPTGGNYMECETLFYGVEALENAFQAATSQTGTGLTGWVHTSADDLIALMNTPGASDVIAFDDLYWGPPTDWQFESRSYTVFDDDPSKTCNINHDSGCSGFYTEVIDQWDATSVGSSTKAKAPCSFGVGGSPAASLAKETGITCSGSVMLSRGLRGDEKYWP